jgi:hypothetical protein
LGAGARRNGRISMPIKLTPIDVQLAESHSHVVATGHLPSQHWDNSHGEYNAEL